MHALACAWHLWVHGCARVHVSATACERARHALAGYSEFSDAVMAAIVMAQIVMALAGYSESSESEASKRLIMPALHACMCARSRTHMRACMCERASERANECASEWASACMHTCMPVSTCGVRACAWVCTHVCARGHGSACSCVRVHA